MKKWQMVLAAAVCAACMGSGAAGAAGPVEWDGVTQTHVQGVQIQDGNVGANGVAAKNVRSSTLQAGNLYGNLGNFETIQTKTLHAELGGIGLLQVSSDGRSGRMGRIHWGSEGTLFGIKSTDWKSGEPTAAVNVDMLRQAVAALQAENEALRKEIEALKAKV